MNYRSNEKSPSTLGSLEGLGSLRCILYHSCLAEASIKPLGLVRVEYILQSYIILTNDKRGLTNDIFKISLSRKWRHDTKLTILTILTIFFYLSIETKNKKVKKCKGSNNIVNWLLSLVILKNPYHKANLWLTIKNTISLVISLLILLNNQINKQTTNGYSIKKQKTF